MIAFLFFACAAITVVSSNLVLPVPDPVPEQTDPEWTMIPDDEGKLYLVNVETALDEPQPTFDFLNGVIFELYTLRDPKNAQIIRINDVESLTNSDFNASRPTKFVVHGFNSKGSLTVAFQNAYFIEGQKDVNLIAVNWQAGSSTFNYIAARHRVNYVGPHVARFIEFLMQFGHVNLEDIVLIGHSLGAHIAGLAGKHMTAGQLPKIIGLDPANPLFSYRNPDERIAVGDARSVEIMITNGGGLGFSAPLGDVNFYPNGGRSQPGCRWDFFGTCAHSRAHQLYIESINTPMHFYGYQCESYEEIRRGHCTVIGNMRRMGGDTNNRDNAEGVFFLETNNQAPFARGLTSP